jgi:hypothetical protein
VLSTPVLHQSAPFFLLPTTTRECSMLDEEEKSDSVLCFALLFLSFHWPSWLRTCPFSSPTVSYCLALPCLPAPLSAPETCTETWTRNDLANPSRFLQRTNAASATASQPRAPRTTTAPAKH